MTITLRIAAAIAALLVTTAGAEARHRHHRGYHHPHRYEAPAARAEATGCVSDNNGHMTCGGPIERTTERRIGNSRHAAQYSGQGTAGFSTNALVQAARSHLGTNPTGRGSLWCGAFMDVVLKETGHPPGGNLASAYARYGHRVSGPQVGAIAVMGRRGGGHVGVVSGIDANGNPIIISGNHNHTTAESVYPRGRIYAYVVP